MRYGTGVALVLAAGVLWSLQGLVFRQIEGAGTWPVLVWRSAGMLPVLLAFLAWRTGGAPGRALVGMGWAGLVGGAGLVAAFAGAIHAIQSTTIANAVFLFAASPFLTALLARLVLGERVAPATWAAIGIALAGIFLMVRDGLEGGRIEGNLAALASAAGFAVFTVTLRRAGAGDTLPGVVAGAGLSIVAGTLMALALGETLAIGPANAAWAAGMGAVTLSGGMVLYTLGARVVRAAELALLSNVEVLLAPLWVWVLLGETASAATLAGGAVVLAAVAVNTLGARRPAA